MNWTLIALSFISTLAFASKAEDCEDDTTKNLRPMMEIVAAVSEDKSNSQDCPNPRKLGSICIDIEQRQMDPNPKGDYEYMYQRKILEAACADPEKDSETVIAQKIQKMWGASTEYLNCQSLQFDASGGNVLKYAVSTKFNQVLEDAIYWKVNLNQVDKKDGRTVLDYVQYQIEKNQGTSIEGRLKHYYKILRDAGAKHKKEL